MIAMLCIQIHDKDKYLSLIYKTVVFHSRPKVTNEQTFYKIYVLDLKYFEYSFLNNDINFIPELTARSAVPGVSPGRGLLIPH